MHVSVGGTSSAAAAESGRESDARFQPRNPDCFSVIDATAYSVSDAALRQAKADADRAGAGGLSQTFMNVLCISFFE